MAKVCFQLFACFCLILKWEGNVEASDSVRCGAVKTAIKMNSTWTVRSAQKTISWRGVATAATVLKQCTCNPETGELGDVSRIEYTNSTTGVVYFNNLCVGCPGLQVPVTDFNFSLGVIDHGKSYTDTGPCSDVPVYRCRCPKPSTTNRPASLPPATTLTTTSPPPITTTTTIPPATTTCTTVPEPTDIFPPGDYNYTCNYSDESDPDYDCEACFTQNGVADGPPWTVLLYPGRNGPGSYVQCTYNMCAEVNCASDGIYIASSCTCVCG